MAETSERPARCDRCHPPQPEPALPCQFLDQAFRLEPRKAPLDRRTAGTREVLQPWGLSPTASQAEPRSIAVASGLTSLQRDLAR